ncbi:hypothetical protein RF847_004582 [Salmonella enterica]|nr:hypothetical protein [Salmonella enterica]
MDVISARTNLGLGSIATESKDKYVLKAGDTMTGKLSLPQTSSFGVNSTNTIGGSSIAIGDNDTGFKSNGDGNIALMANNVLAGYFSENELQHSKKMLTQLFQIFFTNNFPVGAGGFGGQLNSDAPFSVPTIKRPNNDNNYFPIIKEKVILDVGYPVAFSMGLLTTGQQNFPQIVIHAKTDFDVNDKIWIFDVATGNLTSPGSVIPSNYSNFDARYNKLNSAGKSQNGWQKDNSTGIITQWGYIETSNGTFNFPVSFPNQCYVVLVGNTNAGGGRVDNAYGWPLSNSQFFAATKDSNAGAITGYPVSWIAVGS